MKWKWVLGCILVVCNILLAGCVSNVPPNISSPVENTSKMNTTDLIRDTVTEEKRYSPELECENLNYQGFLAMLAGSNDEAISFFDQALVINSNFVPALNNKGYAYYKKGDLKNALIYFERAYQQDPNNHIICANKVQTSNELGKIGDTNICRLIDRYSGFCYINLGSISGSMRAPANPLDSNMWKEEAIENHLAECKIFYYQNYLELVPNDAVAWNNYAVVLAVSKQLGKALDAFDKALLLDPGNQTFMKNRDLIQKYGIPNWYIDGDVLEFQQP